MKEKPSLISVHDSTDNCANDFAPGREHRNIGVGSDGKRAFPLFNAEYSRRIDSRHANRILKADSRKLRDVTNRAIESQYATREPALRLAPAVVYFYLDPTK